MRVRVRATVSREARRGILDPPRDDPRQHADEGLGEHLGVELARELPAAMRRRRTCANAPASSREHVGLDGRGVRVAAEEDAHALAVLLGEGEQGVREGRDALARAARGRDGVEALAQQRDRLGHDHAQELALVGEVQVEGAGGDARARGDVVRRDAVQARARRGARGRPRAGAARVCARLRSAAEPRRGARRAYGGARGRAAL